MAGHEEAGTTPETPLVTGWSKDRPKPIDVTYYLTEQEMDTLSEEANLRWRGNGEATIPGLPRLVFKVGTGVEPDGPVV